MASTMYYDEYNILKKNAKLSKRVEEYLVEKFGLENHTKGFKYLVDIIVVALVKKQYTRTFISEISPFISHKYGIKTVSIQRQLRYACTIKTDNKYKVIDIVSKTWYEIKKELEKEK